MSSTGKTDEDKLFWLDLPPYIQIMDLAFAGLVILGLAGMAVYLFQLNEVIQNAIPWIFTLLAAVLTWHYRSRLLRLKPEDINLTKRLILEWILLYVIIFVFVVLVILFYPFSNPS